MGNGFMDDVSQVSLYGDRIPLEAKNRALTRCYSEMGVGLVITGLVAWWFAYNGLLTQLGRSFMFLCSIVTLVLTVVITWQTSGNKIRPMTARILFYLYAALMGCTMSSIFYAYDIKTIFISFFVCAAMFFGLALYGVTSKRDFSRFGVVFLVALIVLIIAEFLIMFIFPNPEMLMIITAVSVVLFAGMTVYDSQQANRIMSYAAAQGPDAIVRSSINCALSLYLDFLNMFINLLRLFGGVSSDND